MRPPTEQEFLEAHKNNDYPRLCALYRTIAELSLKENKIDQACFLYTQAYVYGLSCDDEKVSEIHAILCRRGREA